MIPNMAPVINQKLAEITTTVATTTVATTTVATTTVATTTVATATAGTQGFCSGVSAFVCAYPIPCAIVGIVALACTDIRIRRAVYSMFNYISLLATFKSLQLANLAFHSPEAKQAVSKAYEQFQNAESTAQELFDTYKELSELSNSEEVISYFIEQNPKHFNDKRICTIVLKALNVENMEPMNMFSARVLPDASNDSKRAYFRYRNFNDNIDDWLPILTEDIILKELSDPQIKQLYNHFKDRPVELSNLPGANKNAFLKRFIKHDECVIRFEWMPLLTEDTILRGLSDSQIKQLCINFNNSPHNFIKLQKSNKCAFLMRFAGLDGCAIHLYWTPLLTEDTILRGLSDSQIKQLYRHFYHQPSSFHRLKDRNKSAFLKRFIRNNEYVIYFEWINYIPFTQLSYREKEALLSSIALQHKAICPEFFEKSPLYCSTVLMRIPDFTNCSYLKIENDTLTEALVAGKGVTYDIFNKIIQATLKYEFKYLEEKGFFLPITLSKEKLEKFGWLMAKAFLDSDFYIGVLFSEAFFELAVKYSFDQLYSLDKFSSAPFELQFDCFATVMQLTNPQYVSLLSCIKGYSNQSQAMQTKFKQEIGAYIVASRDSYNNGKAKKIAEKYLNSDGFTINEAFIKKIQEEDCAFKQEVMLSLFSKQELEQSQGIFYIIKGMASSLGKREWEDAIKRDEAAKNLNQSIQGSLNKDKVAEAIVPNNSDRSLIEKVNWIKEWIKNEASIDEIKRFLVWVTGNTAIGTNAKIHINVNNSVVMPHVCYKTLDLFSEMLKIHNKEDFIKELKKDIPEIDKMQMNLEG